MDYLAYGPKARDKVRARDEAAAALERARLLEELRLTSSPTRPQQTEDGYNIALPSTEFSPAMQAERNITMQQAGLDAEKIGEGEIAATRADALRRGVAGIEQNSGGLGQAVALGNLGNDKALTAPVALSGGVAYNPYDPGNPIVGEASAVDALARLRTSQADTEDLRYQALADVLQSEQTNPLLRADIANKKTTPRPTRVKVRRQDGQEVYMDARPNLQGGWDYSEAKDTAGTALRVPPSASGDGRTALQKDTAFISDTLGVQPEEAILWKLQSKAKSDEALWNDIVLRTRSSRKYAGADEVQNESAALWSIMRPGKEPPPLQQQITESPPQQAATNSQDDARRRAGAEGYTNLGQWVEGRGFEVREGGKLIGYYY
ncbi:MAG: hypothetical protein CVV05_15545 [Gammaproteobacteria bacterium HGW-Gammaproteobacteria-1]|jgi:hypothetical protein|nr:MAG: hypothetical protein CVV05_15545 [Gammaproteobacteria bacterium HGW-Gammaproteobacteria-1]